MVQFINRFCGDIQILCTESHNWYCFVSRTRLIVESPSTFRELSTQSKFWGTHAAQNLVSLIGAWDLKSIKS